ncbi:MAG TPA: Gfo/Idh/MocA family oxidoreductase [Dongiaceae bacterium]|nr:Gfo/Idh/MocA family oxidoreductase [Dongiaceae bacterium]
MRKLRIGFLSTANIGRKNWKAIFHSGNCVVSAVASRDLARSQKFISECQAETPFETAPVAFGSYEELLVSKNVDAVYVPLPTGLRKEFVIRAAENGKHILCEKPCAPSAADLEEMISACKKNRVQFMDGVMFMHNSRLGQIRKILNDKKSIGQVKRITSQFSFLGSEDFLRGNIRVSNELEPLGCLGDLGWYCIRFALWTADWQMPNRVEGKIISRAGNNPSGVPLEFSAELFFDGGVSANFYCTFLAAYRQWADITGAQGHLRVPDFVLPTPGSDIAFELNNRNVEIEAGSTAQGVNMFRNFAVQIFSGKLNDEWPMWALKTQQVVDACFASALNG